MSTQAVIKERPILFSSEMVKAILEGRKSQSRRVIKPQPKGAWAAPGRTMCPYGQPGDKLWVRETWCLRATADHFEQGHKLFAKGDWLAGTYEFLRWDRVPMEVLYRATDDGRNWRPSIHMPRWASRITMVIRDIRVERVQDISEADAIAELGGRAAGIVNERGHFMELWDSINAKRGFGWDANPWVWVVVFEKEASNAN